MGVWRGGRWEFGSGEDFDGGAVVEEGLAFDDDGVAGGDAGDDFGDAVVFAAHLDLDEARGVVFDLEHLGLSGAVADGGDARGRGLASR